MEKSRIDYSKYRFEKANKDIESAKMLFKSGDFNTSINRSYYAIFHALRSITVLDNFDSKKHSGIIAYFNKNYLKTGIFDKNISKIINSAFNIRNKSDYEDFYVISNEQAKTQIEDAEKIIEIIKPYLESRWEN